MAGKFLLGYDFRRKKLQVGKSAQKIQDSCNYNLSGKQGPQRVALNPGTRKPFSRRHLETPIRTCK